ncbi:MAG TPA: histidine--tRNA ligase [Pyrinomonadaceae bacterium]|jgi:histidyl-tRNA synthetase
MAQQNTNPARGMRDFLPADVRRREYVIGIIKDVYQKYGFEPLETPAVENLETLLGKYGEEGNQLIFKILKRGEGEKSGEADLALRYDLTVPLARVVANYKNELPKFFKRYQIQPVWRADRPARGRFREFYQCDVDAIGSKSMIVEAELISAVCEVLQRLRFNNFTIRINHRLLLDAIMDAAMIEKEKRPIVLTMIDKLDKIGDDGVKNELQNLGLAENNINVIFRRMLDRKYLSLNSDKLGLHTFSNDNFTANNEHLNLLYSSFKDFSSENEGKLNARKAITDLQMIISFSENFAYRNQIKIDPSLVRGLSYYTGAIFEINVPDLAGSLGGGGRYDGLIGMFGKEEIPACGFSLGLERILVVMDERGMFQELEEKGLLKAKPADVLVTIWNEETIADSLELANDLRAQGLCVVVYPEADKLGKQFKYASSIGVSAVAILGDDERANNAVTIKYLETGEQETISRERLSTELKI